MNCRILRAHSLKEVWQMAMDYPGAAFIAGGTDLLPRVNQKIESYPAIICLDCVNELNKLEGITDMGDYFRLGALTRLTDINSSYELDAYTAVRYAAGQVASPQIRNQATIGGNLLQENRCVYFNQSVSWRRVDVCYKLGGDRCYQYKGSKRCVALLQSDMAPVMMAHRAQLVFNGPEGERLIPIEQLYLQGGQKANKPEEVLMEIRLPKIKGTLYSAYVRETIRGSIDFPIISCAVLLELEQVGGNISNAVMVIGSAGVMPQIIPQMADMVGLHLSELKAKQSELIEAGTKKIAPFKDSRVDGAVRKAMGESVIEKALQYIQG